MTSANFTDEVIRKAVLDELRFEPSVTDAHIGVTARGGVVTLTGNVKSFAEKHAAEKATERVNGVKAVAENIEVRLPSDLKRRDEEIAAATVNQLTWDSEIPRDAVKVKVEKGVVTLTGEVRYYFQKAAAEAHVRRLAGVVSVINGIGIKPQETAGDICEDIQHALHRSVLFQPELVHVTARDGKVKLTGNVRTYQDRQTAAMTAWAASGAISVENEIVVS